MSSSVVRRLIVHIHIREFILASLENTPAVSRCVEDALMATPSYYRRPRFAVARLTMRGMGR
jgi:hypothetical protein